jgi:hypothetical protein
MRLTFLLCSSVLLLAGCGGQPDVQPVVSWQYGAGNGDPIPYPGPAPVYSRSYGMGSDVPVSSGQKPGVQYGYGADNESGVMVQMQPSAPASQRVAAPAPAQQPSPQGAAPSTHS